MIITRTASWFFEPVSLTEVVVVLVGKVNLPRTNGRPRPWLPIHRPPESVKGIEMIGWHFGEPALLWFYFG